MVSLFYTLILKSILVLTGFRYSQCLSHERVLSPYTGVTGSMILALEVDIGITEILPITKVI
jgi:hypothetical protein